MTDLALSVQLETSPGVFLELEDEVNGYSLGSGSFANKTKSYKQHTVGDQLVWLKGEIVTATAPSNVVEPVEIRIFGEDHFTFRSRLKVVEEALTEQLSYRLIVTIGNSRETWTCAPCAQTVLNTQQELLFATQGMLTASVPRLPDVILEAV